MAGDLRAKERAIVTLTSTGSSLATGSAGAANATADFDARSSGNAPDDLQAQFELTAQWATVTGITAGTVVAELYLLPILDGTNAPDIDTTAGTSRLPYASYVGAFEATKAPTANTNARFVTGNVPFNPLLLRPYILNRSGQTMSANWTLKAVSVQAQYT
jgi:hypothetical protein